jgi:signal transduction histidine kinase
MIVLEQAAASGGAYSGLPELSAAVFQLVVTLGIAWLCAELHRIYRTPVYAWWTVAWLLYVLRITAIVGFLIYREWIALYWHQVLTGWVALALLATATVFVRGAVRWVFALAALFPPLWSYIAIYQLDSFGSAAFPAVVFLAGSTLLTGFVFWRHARRTHSVGAMALSIAFVLWGLHHLDYPFVRARGGWGEWGYYLDVLFEVAVGAGILLLVADDLRRGLMSMTTLSGELQSVAGRSRRELLDALLTRPMSLPAVRGAALYSPTRGTYERGTGVAAGWADRAPAAAERSRLEAAVSAAKATTHTAWADPDGARTLPFAAVFPVSAAHASLDVMVIVGESRAPFTVLGEAFLTGLGQQMGGALANAALTERLRQRSADLERLSARMVRQHEEERRRLSRELHDETAQVLSALKIELGVLRHGIAEQDQKRVDDALALADAGIRSIRAVTNELRPALLDDLGLIPALRSSVTDFAARSGVDARFDATNAEGALSLTADAELALFRAVQEGLANVARHADARRVDVTLTARDGEVTLAIADDGVGLADDHHARDTMGLTGMRERVAALGGTLSIDSAAGKGTRLQISLATDGAR